MSRFLRSVSFAILALGLATGCSKKSALAPVQPPAVSPIVGSWHLVGMTWNTSSNESAQPEAQSTVYVLEANNDMTYGLLGYSSKILGTYSFSGSTLVINFPGTPVTSTGVTLTGDDLIVPDPNPAQSNIKSRHFRRISEEKRNELFQTYNVH
jgi:hypothetical protein